MKSVHRHKILFLLGALLLALFLFFSFSYKKAYAWTTNEWRPSVEINKNLDSSNKKLDENNKSVQILQDFINNYNDNKDSDSEKIEQLQEHFDRICSEIEENRNNIEETSKNSYAIFFAKEILDKIVGNDIVTSTLFRWEFVKFLFSLEDDTIIKMLDEYYDAKDELNEAVNNRDDSQNMFTKAQEDLKHCQDELNALQDHINYWQGILPDIYEIENELGAAGESKIEGDGYFCLPCPTGTLSSPFGEARDEGDSGGPVHKGNDFSASEGDPIYAAGDGEVIDVSYDESKTPNSGKFVCIKHDNGLVTYYRHCSHVFVPKGVKVHKGDNIALVGNTGESYGSHLHFQVELNGEAVDGMDYLKS